MDQELGKGISWVIPNGGLMLLCPMAAGTDHLEAGLGWLSLRAPSHTGAQWTIQLSSLES